MVKCKFMIMCNSNVIYEEEEDTMVNIVCISGIIRYWLHILHVQVALFYATTGLIPILV